MRYLDLTVQSLIVLISAAVVINQITTSPDVLLTILIAQLFIGPWQMLSALISVLTNAPLQRLKVRYFVLAIGYLATLVLVVNGADFLPKGLIAAMTIIPAWTFAAYYYYLTWRWVLMRSPSGTFLPHTFF
jgi:hypothetical protein